MKNINHVVIGGTVGKDANLFVTKNGKSICKFSIAHNRSRKNDQSGQWETLNTTWWDISYFGNDAEALADQIKKGQRVVATGSAELDIYQGKDGQQRTSLRVMADSVSVTPDLRGQVPAAPARDPWNSAPQGGFPQNELPPF